MKEKIMTICGVCFLIICIFLIRTAPTMGQNNEQTDVAAQTESTDEVTEYLKGYVISTSLNIRVSPSKESDVVKSIFFKEQINYIEFNDKWVEVIDNGKSVGYASKEYISNEAPSMVIYDVPQNNGFKSYMPYDAITCVNSPQYHLQNDYAYTGDYGIRMVGNRYCVALGTAFNTPIGTYADLVLENGTVIPVIVGDIKDDRDTLGDNITTAGNGCVSEFIIDSNALDSNIKLSGDVSTCCEEWNSKVVEIYIYTRECVLN